MNPAEIHRVLATFDPGGDGEAHKSLELTRSLLEFSESPCSRSYYYPGHITTSGAVIHPDGAQLLLVHHRRLHRWLLPGGHVEPDDASLAASAAREVLEETGVAVAAEAPLVNLDVHSIPPKRGEPPHLHHDLIFAYRAASVVTACSEESHEVVWCGLDEFDRYLLPGPIRRAVARALDI